MSFFLRIFYSLCTFLCASILTFFFVQGCVKYDVRVCPESIPDNQLAKVKCVSPILSIMEIDGKSVHAKNPFANVKSVKVSEGKHTTQIHWVVPRGKNGVMMANSSEMWFLAKAGETYLAQYKRDGDVITFWLEDEKTRKRVGGIVGSVDEPSDSPHESKTKEGPAKH